MVLDEPAGGVPAFPQPVGPDPVDQQGQRPPVGADRAVRADHLVLDRGGTRAGTPAGGELLGAVGVDDHRRNGARTRHHSPSCFALCPGHCANIAYSSAWS